MSLLQPFAADGRGRIVEFDPAAELMIGCRRDTANALAAQLQHKPVDQYATRAR